jgi:hypothetical protein
MNYMPTKSRKWLASGIATAVIASALSLFTVAPASADATSFTVTVSKPARASETYSAGQNQGFGAGPDDSLALLFQFDESLVAGQADDSWLFRMTAGPTGAAVHIYDDSTTDSLTNITVASNLNTFYRLASANQDGGNALNALFNAVHTSGYDDSISADDSIIGMNINLTKVGTYSFDVIIDSDGNGAFTAGELSKSFSVEAYGAPALTWSTSTGTGLVGKDDTLTLTLTGGSLGDNESIKVVDESTMNVTLSSLGVPTNPVLRNNAGGVLAAGTTSESGDDTLTITGGTNAGWVKTGANTMTLSVLVTTSDTATDLTGTVGAYFDGGVGVSPSTLATAVEVTYTISTTVWAIQDLDITAPTTNIIEDDTPATGTYSGQLLKSATTSGSTTVSGTYQLTNVADYGKTTTVALYGDSESTVDVTDTAISTLTVTSSSATGIGTFSFSVPNQYLDASGDTFTIYVGNVSVANAAAGSAPKAYELTATSANPTPVWTVNGLTWKSSESFPGTLIAAVGGTITASVKAQDQYGNALTGQSIVLTTSSTQRNASKRVQSAVSGATGVVSVSMTDAGTAVSTTTATTRDAITLSLVDGLEDDTVGSTESVTVAYYTANTLTAPTTNGVAAAAYDGEPVVPGDGTADAYSSADRDGAAYDDSLMKFDVTSSVLGASVVFTGTSGVRFYSADTVAPIAGSNIGGTDNATTALKGINKVVVASNSTTGIATVYWYCVTTGTCTVTATAGAATASASATYSANAAFARNVVDVKVNDVVGTTGTSTADKKVKVSFKVTDIFGNAVKTFGETPTVDVMVSGVGSIDGLGSQGTLKTGTDGTAQFYAASSTAGSMQITLDGTGGQFAGVASTTLGTSAAADKKTVTITWSAAPAPEVVYAAPTLTVTKSGTKIILDGTAVEGEGDIIVYIKRVGTTKWVEQAATIEVAAPGDYNGMRIAPKSNVLIRVKQEGTGKFSNQVVVLK